MGGNGFSVYGWGHGMSQILLGRDIEVGQWVAMRIPDVVTVDKFGDFSDGLEVYAGAVYHNYRDHDIEIVLSADSPKFMNRRNIRQIFSYPFVQLKCARMTAIVTKKNKRVRRLLEGVGFKYEGNCRRAIDGVQDALIYGILRHEASRWLEGKGHGKEINSKLTAAD
jgi:hypothetical protein